MAWIKCGMLCAGMLVLASPSFAEPAYMVTQRCIWACMSNTPDWSGRNFKAYERCTKTNCNGKETRRRRR